MKLQDPVERVRQYTDFCKMLVLCSGAINFWCVEHDHRMIVRALIERNTLFCVPDRGHAARIAADQLEISTCIQLPALAFQSGF